MGTEIPIWELTKSHDGNTIDISLKSMMGLDVYLIQRSSELVLVLMALVQ